MYIYRDKLSLTGTASKSRLYDTPIAPLPNPVPISSNMFVDARMSDAWSGLWTPQKNMQSRRAQAHGRAPKSRELECLASSTVYLRCAPSVLRLLRVLVLLIA